MSKQLFLFCLLLTLPGCATKSVKPAHDSSDIKSLNLEVHKKTLSNGLRVLVFENDQLPIASYYTFFDVGGRHEIKGQNTGATHFLEHMMFKGGGKFGPGKFDSFIEGSGGNTNAYTSFDNTVYYQNLPSPQISKIIEMEADRMQNILLDPAALEKERKVVFEERKMRYENSPHGQIYLKMMQAVFEKTPYGGSVIGEVEDLNNLTRENLKDFHKKFYAPNNAIIVVAGDVDHDDIFDQVEEHYGKIPRSDTLKAHKEKTDNEEAFRFKGSYGRWEKIHSSSPTPIFMMAYKGEKIGTRRSFVMDILSSILGSGSSSYYNQKFVQNRRPMLNNVGVGNYTLQYNGVFYISGELLRGVNINKFKNSFFKDFNNVCEEAITPRSLQKTKNQYFQGYFRSIQTNAGIASFLGNRENTYNDYGYYKKELEIYDSITVEELKSTCKDIFKSKDYVLLTSWSGHPKTK